MKLDDGEAGGEPGAVFLLRRHQVERQLERPDSVSGYLKANSELEGWFEA